MTPRNPELSGRCQNSQCNIRTDELTDTGLCPLHDRRMWEVLAWLNEWRQAEMIDSAPTYGPVVISRDEYRWAIETNSQMDVPTRQKLRRKTPPELDMPAMDAAILRAVAMNQYQLDPPKMAVL